MGNEDKVRTESERTELARVAREYFLEDAARIEADRPHLYNLEEEFARSKNNRNLRSVFLVLGFIILAIGATIFLTLYVQNQNRKIRIDIRDFEDLALRDLLSSARQNGEVLASAKSSLDAIQQELADKNQALKDDIAGKISVVEAKGLSTEAQDAAVRDLRQQEQAGLAALAAQYAARIRVKQTAVAAAQKQVDAYDSKQLDAARKQAEVLNNQQRLNDMELEQTKHQYETRIKDLTDQSQRQLEMLKATQKQVIEALMLKFNPVFDTPELVSILRSPTDSVVAPTVPALRTAIAGTNYVPDSVLAALNQSVYQRGLLYSRLARIPYVNSVPGALTHLDFLDRSAMRSYENIALKLTQIARDDDALIKEQSRQLSQVRTAFNFYARKIAESGFIVDARDANRIAIFLNPSYTLSNGDLGLVFRQDDEFIGTIKFVVSSRSISARQIELSANKTIQPFDKFLINRM